MSSWGTFNSIVTEENIPEKVVGVLPVLPHPVTDHETVFTAMHQLMNLPNQLGLSFPPVFGDKGVFHIAREIQFHHPGKFRNLVIHMTKIFLGCMG